MPVTRRSVKSHRSAAGSYDQWLIFEILNNGDERNEFGDPVEGYHTHFETWGAYEPLGSREFPATDKRNAESTARFRIPYAGYTLDPAKHRVVMEFDLAASPPNSSTWNVIGAYGDRFETIVEVNEVV